MKNSIKEHLKQYGIYEMDEDKYWAWGGRKLGEREATRLEQLRDPIVEGYATEEDLNKFYEYIAKPKIASVVHTMKYNEIEACYTNILSELNGNNILEIGCNIGYGTTWLARNLIESNFIGVDKSVKSIKTATNFAKRFNLSNISFKHDDILSYKPDFVFDYIISNQCVMYIDDIESALSNMVTIADKNSQFIFIEALETSEQILDFIDMLIKSNIYMNKFEFIKFRSHMRLGAYSCIRAGLTNTDYQIDIKEEFNKMLKLIEEDNS